MKKIKIISICCFAIVGFSSLAIANEKKWEIWTGGFGNFSFAFQNHNTITNLNVFSVNPVPAASIGYIFSPGIEAIFSPGLQWTNTSAAKNMVINFNPLLGINFSFSQEIEDSPYIQLQAGITLDSSTDYNLKKSTGKTDTYFQWAAQVGKRFKLAEGIVYAPAISFNMVMSDSEKVILSLIPVQFSFLL